MQDHPHALQASISQWTGSAKEVNPIKHDFAWPLTSQS